MFCQITGDINPLHNDTTFAKGKGFNNKVVYGMLTASFYSTLVGVFIPGKNSLIHSIEIKFLKPVFIGDDLNIKGTVVEKNDTFKTVVIKSIISRNKGGGYNLEKVSKSIIKVGILDD